MDAIKKLLMVVGEPGTTLTDSLARLAEESGDSHSIRHVALPTHLAEVHWPAGDVAARWLVMLYADDTTRIVSTGTDSEMRLIVGGAFQMLGALNLASSIRHCFADVRNHVGCPVAFPEGDPTDEDMADALRNPAFVRWVKSLAES